MGDEVYGDQGDYGYHRSSSVGRRKESRPGHTDKWSPRLIFNYHPFGETVHRGRTTHPGSEDHGGTREYRSQVPLKSPVTESGRKGGVLPPGSGRGTSDRGGKGLPGRQDRVTPPPVRTPDLSSSRSHHIRSPLRGDEGRWNRHSDPCPHSGLCLPASPGRVPLPLVAVTPSFLLPPHKWASG